MNLESLLPAVQEAAPWLARFRKSDYPDAFREYRETYEEPFARALWEEEPEELAEELLDALEEGWRRRRWWNRTAARMNEKQVIVVYLTPMLLEEGDPERTALAEALQRGWARRRPEESYQLGRFEIFQKGFRTAVFGIPVGERREE